MGLPALEEREALPIATTTGDAVAGPRIENHASVTAYKDDGLDDPGAGTTFRRDKEQWRNQADGFLE
jgi:hypothetical protein